MLVCSWTGRGTGSVDFERNRIYFRRQDIHDRFGGQQQGGISTPAGARVIFAFTGEVGQQHGYTDYWTDDGVFCYFGEGQTGDMTFRAGNKAIRDHAANGKDLLVFQMLGRGRANTSASSCARAGNTNQPQTAPT